MSGPVDDAFADPRVDGHNRTSVNERIMSIKDINVDAGFPRPFPRLFTHYWRWHKTYESELPAHILALQDSLDLKRDR